MTDASAEAAPAVADASMHDMLRIMDVASALRRQRETAEAQLDLATQKARLRERLLATAVAAGEPVTAAEVDTAIEEYFRRQHEYSDPPAGLSRLLATAWVLRKVILAVLLVIVVAAVGIVMLANAMSSAFSSRPAAPPARMPPLASVPASPPPAAVRPAPPTEAPDPDARFAEAWERFVRTSAAAAQIATDADAGERVRGAAAAGEAARTAADLVRLRRAQQELDALVARLEEEYVVTIVSRPGEKSGIDRYEGGRLSGYYLIVEAVAPDGRRLTRRIQNAETQRTDAVTQWGELVPEAVWNRVVADKQADGVVDETQFAHKRRGSFAETTTILDGSGRPLRRGRQITQW